MPPAKNGLVLLSLPDGFGELVQLPQAATVCEVGLASMLAWPWTRLRPGLQTKEKDIAVRCYQVADIVPAHRLDDAFWLPAPQSTSFPICFPDAGSCHSGRE
jgi:hypothetical protein